MYDELLLFVQNKINEKCLIKFLNRIKDYKFITETDSIVLNYDKKDLILYKEDFLKNLPIDTQSTHTIDNNTFTIGYPDINNLDNFTFLKKIDGIEIQEKDYKYIPLSFYKRIKQYIIPYKNNLRNTYVYYVNEHHYSRFTCDKNIIINIIYLAFVYDYNTLIKDQVFLMKHFNFTRSDFDQINYNQYKDYVKVINKMTKDEQPAR
tara:strand:- start:69 stop:686 length:618 start_codon:yes stop_codon:yes gene_type:complete